MHNHLAKFSEHVTSLITNGVDVDSILIMAVLLFALVVITWVIFVTGRKEIARWVEIEIEKEKQKRKEAKPIKFLEEAKKANVLIRNETFIVVTGLALVFSTSVALAFRNPFLFLITLGTLWFVFRLYIFEKERKLRETIKNQLGAALQNLGAAYRTQKNWLVALETTTPMLQSPLKEEFERVLSEHQTGMPISEAFQGMQERLNIPEMQLFITMVEISEKAGSEASEGIFTAGAYFQTRRVAVQEIANAMMSAMSENKGLVYMFFGMIAYFRFFQEQIFAGFLYTIIGKVLLALFLGVAIVCLVVSFRIVRREV